MAETEPVKEGFRGGAEIGIAAHLVDVDDARLATAPFAIDEYLDLDDERAAVLGAGREIPTAAQLATQGIELAARQAQRRIMAR